VGRHRTAVRCAQRARRLHHRAHRGDRAQPLPPRKPRIQSRRCGSGEDQVRTGRREGTNARRRRRSVGGAGEAGLNIYSSIPGGEVVVPSVRSRGAGVFVVLALLALPAYHPLYPQSGPRTTATPQKLDEDYTSRIKKATPDPRIITELVDHMPASAT